MNMTALSRAHSLDSPGRPLTQEYECISQILAPPSLHLPHRKSKLLASKDPDPRNRAAIVGSKENDTGKGILPQFVQSLDHSSDEAATHEGLGELFREAILRVPQGPAIFIKVISKVQQGHGERILVGVLALKFIQHKGTARRE